MLQPIRFNPRFYTILLLVFSVCAIMPRRVKNQPLVPLWLLFQLPTLQKHIKHIKYQEKVEDAWRQSSLPILKVVLHVINVSRNDNWNWITILMEVLRQVVKVKIALQVENTHLHRLIRKFSPEIWSNSQRMWVLQVISSDHCWMTELPTVAWVFPIICYWNQWSLRNGM